MDYRRRQNQNKKQDFKDQKIEQANTSNVEEELINYDSQICTLGLIQGNYLGMGFDEGYRKAASNTMVIGKHLGKLAKSFKMEEKWEFHCIGKL